MNSIDSKQLHEQGKVVVQNGEYQPCNGKTPYIHKIKTKKNKYIYDVTTRRLARVDEVIWEIISDVGALTKPEIISKYADHFEADKIDEAYESIIEQQEQGLFLDKRPKVELTLSEERIRNTLLNDREILILNVTERCNFRCKYCTYDGFHKNQPAHSTKQMEWSVAKKAIDEFLTHSTNAERPAITFYGGEPLMNFDLIRECVKYVNKKMGRRKVHFSMTTNGSLLKGEIAEFLASEHIGVNVSIDGPREIHDRYRRTIDDKPTWDLVVRNVREFREFRKRNKKNNYMIFMVVMAPPLNVEDLYNFFSTSDLFTENTGFQVSIMNIENCPRDDIYPKGKIKGIDELYKKYYQKLISGEFNRNPRDQGRLFLKVLFEKDFLGFNKRFDRGLRKEFPDIYCSLSTCVPGTRRTFVGTEGGYWPCERVPQSESLRVGHVNDGFDILKIHRLLKEWVDMTKDQCEQCWAFGNCNIGCLSNFNDGEKTIPDLKRAGCQKERDKKHDIMTSYCKVLEADPTNLDYMNEITVS